MTRSERTLLVSLGIALTVGMSHAAAQTTTLTPSATLGIAHDDNLFWTPVSITDSFWRVSPAFTVTHESPRSDWFGTYSFDAERYRTYPSLTTPQARRNGAVIARFRPDSPTMVTAAGGYDSSLVASELNVTTGLGLPRLGVWRWYASPEVKRLLTATTAMDVIYQLSRDGLTFAEAVTTHAVDATISHEVTARGEVRVKTMVRRYLFGAQQSGHSEGVVVGWRGKATPFTTWSVAAGPRFNSGSPQPEIEASIVRRAGLNGVSVFFDRTQTTAIGVVGLVDVQRVLGTFDQQLPHRFAVSLRGGAYSNDVGASHVKVYRIAPQVSKGLGPMVSLSMSYGLDFQNGIIGIAIPLTTDRSAIAPVVVQPPQQVTGWLRRNLFLFQLTISPETRKRRENPENPTEPGLKPLPQGSTPLDRSDR